MTKTRKNGILRWYMEMYSLSLFFLKNFMPAKTANTKKSSALKKKPTVNALTKKCTPRKTTKKVEVQKNFFSTEERPGTLIIVEGSDGSGKSTQLLVAKNLLESNGFFCVHSEWNSSEMIHPMQKRFKKFDPYMPAAVFDMIYASDFIERYITQIR